MHASNDRERPLLELRLLGELQAKWLGQPLPLGGTQARSLLAVLVLRAGETVSKRNLIECAWSGDPPATADDLVAAYLSRLRKALAPAKSGIGLVSARPGFRAELDPNIASVDVFSFTKLLRLARREQEDHEDELAAGHLEQALKLWGGDDVLVGFESEWLRQQATVLEERRLDAIGALARIHLAAGRPEKAADLSAEAALAHPEREQLAVTLVRALTEAGEAARAAETATRAATALVERGLIPGPELRQAQRAALAPRQSPPKPARDARHQLPVDTRSFTGRTDELALLIDLVGARPDRDGAQQGEPGARRTGAAPAPAGPTRQAGAVGLIAVDGMAGIGKTAFAVHLGHRLAERYPDGQLFVDLRGHSKEHPPRSAAEVLESFLRALGTPPGRIPEDQEARATEFRDRLAGTRTLIVLDNAGTESQVRPLLPGSGGCLVLVTSRRKLKGLDDAYALSLEVPPLADAIALFRSVAGAGRVAAGDQALERVVELCAQLPLALRIAAALMRHRPSWNVDHLVSRLGGQDHRIDRLSDGERDLGAVFDLSYEALKSSARRLYRRVGLHPGPDVDAHAAAALIESDPGQASELLEELYDHNLLSQPVAGRYQLHDLLRIHARERAHSDAEDEEVVRSRLLDYYLAAAQSANQHLARRTTQYTTTVSTPPQHIPEMENRAQAVTWMRAELPNLAACAAVSAERAQPTHLVALSAALHGYLYIEGPWSYSVSLHARAAAAAEQLNDVFGQATALHSLGRVRRQTGDYEAGAADHQRSWELYKSLDHEHGQANALDGLGRIRWLTGDYPDATRAFNQALEVFERVGDALGTAGALNGLGRVRGLTGDPAGAVTAHRRALELSTMADDDISRATALNDLGRAYARIQNHPAATNAQKAALELYRKTNHILGQANATHELGLVQEQTGDVAVAKQSQEHAHELYLSIGHKLGRADSLQALGRLHQASGDSSQAHESYHRALSIYREVHNRRGESQALYRSGTVLAELEFFDQARRAFEEALHIALALGSVKDQADCHDGIAETYLREGETDLAAAALREAVALRQGAGLRIDRLVTRTGESGGQ